MEERAICFAAKFFESRQKFFDKDRIDAWLMGKPNLSDEHLEQEFNKQLLNNKKQNRY